MSSNEINEFSFYKHIVSPVASGVSIVVLVWFGNWVLDVRGDLRELKDHMTSHENGTTEWKDRIIQLEEFSMKGDRFTAADGNKLESRVEFLERKLLKGD